MQAYIECILYVILILFSSGDIVAKNLLPMRQAIQPLPMVKNEKTKIRFFLERIRKNEMFLSQKTKR
jgi:hypothetical protein